VGVYCVLQDHKLKHMADLQQSVVSDAETKRQITGQIVQWEENLERLHCEQFRLRCYMASLQSGELPNPKASTKHPVRPFPLLLAPPRSSSGSRRRALFSKSERRQV
jgi:T-lymphoma invasion and metastasis CC-Ex domain